MPGWQHFFLFRTALRLKRCALDQLRWIYGSCTMFLIGLWYYKKCGMKTSMMMMMSLLSGTVGIKTQGPKSTNKRITPTRCLAFQLCDGFVYVRRREQVLEVTDSCL